MRFPAPTSDLKAWAVQVVKLLSSTIGTRNAAGIASDLVELSTGTSTSVPTVAAKPGRSVILTANNSSGVNAGAWVPPITQAGTFEINHASGSAGRVLTWMIV